MRGGTSRALFFRDEDLPADPEVRQRVILNAFGCPDPYGTQIDGRGGATAPTNKLAIIGRSNRPDAQIDYTFGQLGADRPFIDGTGTCGNISAAVAPYAIDEGLVPAAGDETVVRFVNTNTDRVVVAHVRTRDGHFEPEGSFAIDGIPGTGSKIVLDYLDPGGAVTGKLLPTGRPRDVIEVPGVGPVEMSIVDAGNPMVYTRFEAFGMTGDEDPEAIDGNPELLRRMMAVRAAAGVAAGIGSTPEEVAERYPSVPKLAFVAPARAYRQLDGVQRDPETIDLTVRSMTMGKLHRAFQLTGAICVAVAAAIPDTLVHEVASAQARETGYVRIGHPSGIMDLSATVVRDATGGWRAEKVSSTRTARRLMDGFVYVPERHFAAEHQPEDARALAEAGAR